MGGHHSSLEGTLASDALPEIDFGSASHHRSPVGAFSSASHGSLPPAAFTSSAIGDTGRQSGSNQQQRRRELRNSTNSLPGSSATSAAADAASAAAKRFSHFFLFPGPSSSTSRVRLPAGGGGNEQQPLPGIVVVNPGPKASAASSLPRLDAVAETAPFEGRLFAAFSCGVLDSGVNWETRELARIPRFTPILPPAKSTTWIGGGGGKNAVRPASPLSQTLIAPGDFQPLAEMINRYEEFFQNSTAPLLQKQEELTCLQRKVEYQSQRVLQLMYDRQNGKAFASPAKLATDLTHVKPPRAAGNRQLDAISTGLVDLHRLVAESTELLRKLTLDVGWLQERVSTLTDTPFDENSFE